MIKLATKKTIGKGNLMKGIAFIISILIFFTSCSRENDEKQFEKIYTLETSNKLVIPIDSQTNFKSDYMDVYLDKNNSKEFLAYLNSANSHIQLYNLRNKKMEKEIIFPTEGPNAITNVSSFYIHNLDSIILISNYFHKVYLANFKGKVLKTFNLINSFPFSFTNCGNKVDFLNSQFLIYNTLPFVWPNQYGKWKYYLTFLLDTKNGKTDSLYKYEGDKNQYIYGYGYGLFSFTLNDKKEFVYSMHMDENIQVYHFEKKKTINYYAGTHRAHTIPPMKKKGASENEQYIFYNQNYSYRHIIYDKYREVYYRMLLHPTKADEKDYFHGKSLSFIILDKNFKKVGETEVFSRKYAYESFFVTSKGLHISNNHPQNPDLDEDKLSFTLFKLVKNE